LIYIFNQVRRPSESRKSTGDSDGGPQLNEYRSKARELLDTETGYHYKKKRNIEIESVFGDIKHNREYKRFKLRGIEKVNIETGIISIAHSMIKWGKKKIEDKLKMNLAVAY
jgi:hypothetical protein